MTAGLAGRVDALYAPVGHAEMLLRLRAAGVSPEALADLDPVARQDFEAAGLRFLSLAAWERRPFPVRIDPAGVTDLWRLPVADRAVQAALLASLADAWLWETTQRTAPPPAVWLEQRWPIVRRLMLLGARPVVVIGDSHAMMYRRSPVRGRDWLLPLLVECPAGSAIGLANKQSRSGHGGRVAETMAVLDALPGAARLPVLAVFGQVDTEFVYPFRLVRDGGTAFDADRFAGWSRESVQAYVGFLAGLVPAERRARVTVVGLFPPALSDATLAAGYLSGEIALLESEQQGEALLQGLRGLHWPTLAARTGLHAAFNRMLAEAAAAAGFGYADAFEQLLGPDGVIDPGAIPYHGGSDHHLDFAPVAPVIEPLLWRLSDAALAMPAA